MEYPRRSSTSTELVRCGASSDPGSSASVGSVPESAAPVRIGILGAARIAPLALINPARGNAEVVVAAVAARDVSRAQAFAAKHGIARVHDSYEALIADPDLDAVYNPLPNGLHGRWTRAALAAGKHVLCEKPFTANAAEAREIAELAAKSDRVVMEAFHYRYHPLALRVEQIIASGELGKLRAGGGGLLLPAAEVLRHSLQLLPRRRRDNGCRMLCGPHGPHVRWFDAGSRFGTGENARFPGGPSHDGRVAVRGRAHRPGPLLNVVVGSAAGERQGGWRPRRAAGAQSGITSHFPSALGAIGRRQACRSASRGAPSYAYQLDAFAAAVLRGEPVKTTPQDAIENMAVIDGIYRAAGLAAARAGLNAEFGQCDLGRQGRIGEPAVDGAGEEVRIA